MDALMLALWHRFKIGWIVIAFIFVSMMDNPSRRYRPIVLFVDNSVRVPAADVLVT
jgi:hypothetical protein